MHNVHCLLESFRLSSNRQQLLRCWRDHPWIQTSWNITDWSPICSVSPKLWREWLQKSYYDTSSTTTSSKSHQSLYSTDHSTETALLRTSKSILCALDTKQSIIILMLDMPAAFDAVDRTILLDMLKDKYGILEMAFKCFTSYVVMSIGNVSHGYSGVLRGSSEVLGPLNFIVYSSPTGDSRRKRRLAYYLGLYADDTQLYLTFRHGSDHLYDGVLYSWHTQMDDY